MRPLQAIAMGMLIVLLVASFGGYDALPDPLGWVLVLVGTHALPRDLERRGALVVLGWTALAVSVPLWFPGTTDRLLDLHPALVWAAELPQLAYAGLLALVLARRAGRAGDRGAAAWGRTASTGFVAAAVLPVLVLGGGVAWLEEPAFVVAALARVVLVWTLFSWSGRPWVHPVLDPVDQTGA